MLPKLDVPTYQIELPLSKKKIKYRPFLVKEQKNLLMAVESQEAESIHNAIKDVLENCTITENVNIDELPIIDIEYYFINLRAKSVGEIVELKYRCNNTVDGKNCNNLMDVSFNLQDVKVTNNEINPEVQITDNITIKLKYPEFGAVKDSLDPNSVADTTFSMIANSIEYIYDGQQFYYAKEVQKKELIEFIESMNQTQFSKMEQFFNNLPELKETIHLKCKKCGFEHHIEVEGLENFFE